MFIDCSQTIHLSTEFHAYSLPRIDTLVNKVANYHVFPTFDLRSAMSLPPNTYC